MTSEFELQVRMAQANVMRAQSLERDWAAFQAGRATSQRVESEDSVARVRTHLLLQNP